MGSREMKTISATGRRGFTQPFLGDHAVYPERAGFTFIELLVVILIIGIMTSVSVPGFRKTFDNLELDNFAKDIFYLCHYLKSAAISERSIYVLGIDPGKAEFTAYIKSPEGEKVTQLKGKFGKPYRAPKGVKFSVQPAEKTQVYFYPDGGADAVAVALWNKFEKKVSLSIEGALGEIKVQ